MPKQGTANRPAGACAAPCARCGAAQAERLASVLVELRQVLDELPARVAAEVAALQAAPPVHLAQLLAAIRARFGDRAWTVSDLRALGLVQPHDTRRTGRALAELYGQGGRAGPLQLQRLRTGRDGAEWQLVGGGDDPSPQRQGAATIQAVQTAWRQHR